MSLARPMMFRIVNEARRVSLRMMNVLVRVGRYKPILFICEGYQSNPLLVATIINTCTRSSTGTHEEPTERRYSQVLG